MKKGIVVVLALGVVLAVVSPAFALTADPDTGIDMVAGNVYALAHDGNFEYVGGKFDAIRNTSNKTKCSSSALVRFYEGTGSGDCSWTPSIPAGNVYGVAVNSGFVYAGGDFGLVKVSITTGQVDGSFNVSVNNVRAVTADPNGTGVYVGGAFNRVNGKTHHDIALVNSNGTTDEAFQGDLENGRVSHIRIGNGYIVASGSFDTASGVHMQSIAELALNGAAITSFSPSIPENPMQCFDTAPTPTVIYAACGQHSNFMAAFNASTGAQIWRKGIGGNGESISLTTVGGQSTLFVGGHMGTRDPQSMPCGSNYLQGIIKVNPATGAADCNWHFVWYPNVRNYTGGWVQDVVNGHLWVGGKVSKINGVQHHGVARWTL